MNSKWLYDRVIDRAGRIVMLICGDGNIRMIRQDSAVQMFCSEQFAFLNGRLVGTGSQQVLHYYLNTMKQVGVSRLRASTKQMFPNGAVLTVAAGYHDPGGKSSANDGLFLFTDSNNNVLYPILCNYAGGTPNSRVFLATSISSGIKSLLSPDLQYTVTGGRVSDCTALPISFEAENYRYQRLSN